MAQEIRDGFTTLIDGMHAGLAPLLLKPTNYALGINVSSRRGLLRTRPGFRRMLDLEGTTFQGVGRWSLNDGDRLVVVIDGKVHVVNCDDFTEETLNPGLVGNCYFSQPDRWFLIQDGASRPAVLDLDGGTLAMYREPTDSVPINLTPGTISTYAHGRIFYVPEFVPGLADTDGDGVPDITTVDGRTTFVACDVRDVLNPEYVFRLTEQILIAEGGALSLPGEFGFITGMAPLRNAATGTGVGALVIFGREGVSAFDISIPRDQWQRTNISQVLFAGASTRSSYSIVSVNGDLFFVDTEGHIRSLRYTATELAGALTNTPKSYELDPYVSRINLDIASMAYSDNRLLTTFRGTSDYFLALASLDFAPIYGMTAGPSPIYDGFMTGFQYLRTVAAKRADRLETFVVVKRTEGGFSILMLDDTLRKDLGTSAIESMVLTRRFIFESLVTVKQLLYTELMLSELYHDTEVSVYFRPDSYPNWTLVGTKSLQIPEGSDGQFRRRMRFGVDFDSVLCQDTNNEKLYSGYGFQFLIKITGHAVLEYFHATASPIAEAPPECEADNASDVPLSAGTVIDYFGYEVTV